MKKALNIFLRLLVGLILLANVYILITGKLFLYKALYYQTADIDDYTIFENRKVTAGEHQAWPVHEDYNSKELPKDVAQKLEATESVAYVVIKDSALIYEEYWDGYDENSMSNSFSMAKTFVSILVGVALGEGEIPSIDAPVSDYIESFKEGDKSKITIKHLLTMSSGLNWEESYLNPLSMTTESYYGSSLKKLVLSQECVENPGIQFKYLSGNQVLLAMVLEKATGMTISEYTSEKLWKPMGAKNTALWSLDKENGLEKAYCCFNSNAKDFARFGQLFLGNGRWKGNQLVPETYVIESINSAELIDEDGGKLMKYGYSWWITEYDNKYVYYARGILGQYIIVIPELSLVVVRLGHEREEPNAKGHPKEIYSYIRGAVSISS